MRLGQWNFLPSNKLSIHTKEGVFLYCVRDTFPNLSSIFSAIIELILLSICETLLSSTNHLMVHWFSFIILFAMKCSYGLSLTPNIIVLFRKVHTVTGHYLSYHELPLGFAPTVTSPLFIRYHFFVLRVHFIHNFCTFTLEFHVKILSSGSDAWRYTLGTSKLCTALLLWGSIINNTNNASIMMVGGVTY